MKKIIINSILSILILLTGIKIARAQMGGYGMTNPQFWKYANNVLSPITLAWQLGSNSTKIVAGYFTNLFADNATIGTLLISSSAEGPLIIATSTNPFIQIEGDIDTGLSTTAYNSLGIRTGGTDRLVIDNNSSIFSNSLRASSTLMVTGATTLHNTLNVTGLVTLGNASTTLLSVNGTEYIGGANGLVLSDGSILDASGTISFGNENLTTTGTFSGLDLTATSGLRIGEGSSGVHITALGDDTLFVEGQSEFDGTSWFDGSLKASSTLLVTGNTTFYGNTNQGSIEFAQDSGLVTALDMPVSSSASNGNVEGYNFAVDGTNILTVYSKSDGAGSIATSSIGIGTTAPLTKFNVVETSSLSPRGILSSQYSTDTNGARVGFTKARGTLISPLTIVTGDTLGRLMFRGYDGTNYLEMASIEAVSSGTVTTTRVPTYMSLSTATDATPSVLTERMRITNAGKVGIGTTTPPVIFTVSSGATATTTTQFGTLGANKGTCFNVFSTNGTAMMMYFVAGASTPTTANGTCP